jgi:hypothetical protein
MDAIKSKTKIKIKNKIGIAESWGVQGAVKALGQGGGSGRWTAPDIPGQELKRSGGSFEGSCGAVLLQHTTTVATRGEYENYQIIYENCQMLLVASGAGRTVTFSAAKVLKRTQKV